MKVNRTCEICGKVFSVTQNYLDYNRKRFGKEVARYCSKNCYYKSPARKPNAGKFGEKSCGWKGGRLFERGYKMVIAYKHPFAVKKGRGVGYVREHRLVMEKELGRLLLPNECVHHKNGNTLDNRVENLCVMTNEEHNRMHINAYWNKTKKEVA